MHYIVIIFFNIKFYLYMTYHNKLFSSIDKVSSNLCDKGHDGIWNPSRSTKSNGGHSNSKVTIHLSPLTLICMSVCFGALHGSPSTPFYSPTPLSLLANIILFFFLH